MCRAAKCRTCGKTTWAGCGEHVQAVKKSVSAAQWCGGTHTQAHIDAAKASRGGRLARFFGR